jgi:Zn-dependent peptidase ImmA (M78 family)
MISTVKIGSLDYSVNLVADLKRPEDDAMLYGYVSHINQRIDVEQNMTIPTQKIALLHETLHGIMHQSGIISDDEESIVIAISHGLYALLRNNPELVDYIVKP